MGGRTIFRPEPLYRTGRKWPRFSWRRPRICRQNAYAVRADHTRSAVSFAKSVRFGRVRDDRLQSYRPRPFKMTTNTTACRIYKRSPGVRRNRVGCSCDSRKRTKTRRGVFDGASDQIAANGLQRLNPTLLHYNCSIVFIHECFLRRNRRQIETSNSVRRISNRRE